MEFLKSLCGKIHTNGIWTVLKNDNYTDIYKSSKIIGFFSKTDKISLKILEVLMTDIAVGGGLSLLPLLYEGHLREMSIERLWENAKKINLIKKQAKKQTDKRSRRIIIHIAYALKGIYLNILIHKLIEEGLCRDFCDLEQHLICGKFRIEFRGDYIVIAERKSSHNHRCRFISLHIPISCILPKTINELEKLKTTK